MSIGQTLQPLVDLIFPPRCPLCGDGIGTQTGLCTPCWATLAVPGEPACTACCRPFGEPALEGATCAPCLKDPPKHAGIAAATLYNDSSRKLVLAFKHGSRLGLAPMMAGMILPKVRFVDEEWVVVPVPLHRWRLWKRGYNQAAELARHLARGTGGRLCVDALVRRKATPSLGGLGKLARRRALTGVIAIAAARAPQVGGKKVLLVDDVLTSGATSNACVSALRRAGAEKVVIACFARVLDEALDAT
ncbi:ComF family protein [Novosphingobium sp. FGD1]|jgi:ComF family protein|uniref:ComF family protein n=2 Tax=Novosphingobium silvae TaxID=2692619 RepID=A0A7X4GFW9_9SPHN|nr:ComF family protein [Novosphingobium silvae]MYL97871.1 ComF family protein [Novosphingobium silvae]